MAELAKKIRAKFPGAYDDRSDDELEQAWLKKYPGVVEYESIASENARIASHNAQAAKAAKPTQFEQEPEKKRSAEYMAGSKVAASPTPVTPADALTSIGSAVTTFSAPAIKAIEKRAVESGAGADRSDASLINKALGIEPWGDVAEKSKLKTPEQALRSDMASVAFPGMTEQNVQSMVANEEAERNRISEENRLRIGKLAEDINANQDISQEQKRNFFEGGMRQMQSESYGPDIAADLAEGRRIAAQRYQQTGDMNEAVEAGRLHTKNLIEVRRRRVAQGALDAEAATNSAAYDGFINTLTDPREFSRFVLQSGIPLAIAIAATPAGAALGGGVTGLAGRLALGIYGTTASTALLQKIYDGEVNWNEAFAEGVSEGVLSLPEAEILGSLGRRVAGGAGGGAIRGALGEAVAATGRVGGAAVTNALEEFIQTPASEILQGNQPSLVGALSGAALGGIAGAGLGPATTRAAAAATAEPVPQFNFDQEPQQLSMFPAQSDAAGNILNEPVATRPTVSQEDQPADPTKPAGTEGAPDTSVGFSFGEAIGEILGEGKKYLSEHPYELAATAAGAAVGGSLGGLAGGAVGAWTGRQAGRLVGKRAGAKADARRAAAQAVAEANAAKKPAGAVGAPDPAVEPGTERKPATIEGRLRDLLDRAARGPTEVPTDIAESVGMQAQEPELEGALARFIDLSALQGGQGTEVAGQEPVQLGLPFTQNEPQQLGLFNQPQQELPPTPQTPGGIEGRFAGIRAEEGGRIPGIFNRRIEDQFAQVREGERAQPPAAVPEVTPEARAQAERVGAEIQPGLGVGLDRLIAAVRGQAPVSTENAATNALDALYAAEQARNAALTSPQPAAETPAEEAPKGKRKRKNVKSEIPAELKRQQGLATKAKQKQKAREAQEGYAERKARLQAHPVFTETMNSPELKDMPEKQRRAIAYKAAEAAISKEETPSQDLTGALQQSLGKGQETPTAAPTAPAARPERAPGAPTTRTVSPAVLGAMERAYREDGHSRAQATGEAMGLDPEVAEQTANEIESKALKDQEAATPRKPEARASIGTKEVKQVPVQGVDIDVIKKNLPPGLRDKVKQDKNGDYVLSFPNGTIRIAQSGSIEINFEAIERGWGRAAAEAARRGEAPIKGVTEPNNVSREAVIKLVEQGELPHEITHAWVAFFATKEEISQIFNELESEARQNDMDAEEALAVRANDYMARLRSREGAQPQNVFERVFQRMLDFFNDVYDSYKLPATTKAIKAIASGYAFQGKGRGVTVEGYTIHDKYSLNDSMKDLIAEAVASVEEDSSSQRPVFINNDSAASGSGGSFEARSRAESMAAKGQAHVIVNNAGIPRMTTEDGAMSVHGRESFGILHIDGTFDYQYGNGPQEVNLRAQETKELLKFMNERMESAKKAQQRFSIAVSSQKAAGHLIDPRLYGPGMEGVRKLATTLRESVPLPRYSVKTWRSAETGKEKFIQQARALGMPEEDIRRGLHAADVVANIMEKKPFQMPEENVLESSLRKNNDYGVSLDFDTDCPKAEGYHAAVQEIERLLATPLSREKRMALTVMMREMGEVAACLYCYTEMWRNSAAKNAAQAATKGFTIKINGKPRTFPAIDPRIVTDEAYREAKLKGNPKLQAHYKAFQAYVKSAKANIIKPFAPWRAGLLQRAGFVPARVERANANWGVRILSNTDFKVWHALDMIQAALDMAALKLKAHAYTKVEDFVIAFGRTGIKFNMSMFGRAKNNYDIEFDSVDGMDPVFVRWAWKTFPNAGGMMLAPTKETVIAAMRPEFNDMIGQIIPFHASSMSAEHVESMQWENMTDAKESPLTKEELAPGQKPGERGSYIMREVHKDDLETFLRASEKMGLRPRFREFIYKLDKNGKIQRTPNGTILRRWTGPNGLIETAALMKAAGVAGHADPVAVQAYGEQMEQGYMKMVRDYARTDTPFEQVRPYFNVDHIESMLDKWQDSGEKPGEVQANPEVVSQFIALDKKGKLPVLRPRTGIENMPQKERPAYRLETMERLGLSPDGEPKYSVGPLGFYSQLERSVADPKMQAKQRAEEWASTLLKRGVKKAEMLWSGLTDFLKKRAGTSVTKEEIQNYIRDNAVEIVELGNDAQYKPPTLGEVQADVVERNQGHATITFTVPGSNIPAKKAELYFSPENNVWRSRDWDYHGNSHETREYAIAYLKQMYVNAVGTPMLKWKTHSLKGGTNHREIKLTVPRVHMGKAHINTTHWDIYNVAVFMRVADHVTPEGLNVLHVDELQSDWGQAARDEGVKNPEVEAEIQQIRRDREKALDDFQNSDVYKEKFEEYQKINDEYNKWSFGNPEYESAPYDERREKSGKLYRAQAEAEAALQRLFIDVKASFDARIEELQKKVGIIIPGPYLETGEYTDLAVKRLLSIAAKEGYDAVSLTTGQQQNDRWRGLARQVRMITGERDGKGNVKLVAYRTDNRRSRPDFSQTIPEKSLHLYIGHGAAEQLAAKMDEFDARKAELAPKAKTPRVKKPALVPAGEVELTVGYRHNQPEGFKPKVQGYESGVPGILITEKYIPEGEPKPKTKSYRLTHAKSGLGLLGDSVRNYATLLDAAQKLKNMGIDWSQEKPNLTPEQQREYSHIKRELAEANKRKASGEPKDKASIAGYDLRVGGEGLRYNYDQVIPGSFNRLLKKFGGAQMQTVKINSAEGTPYSVHGVTLTPEVRDGIIKEGFPKYSIKTPAKSLASEGPKPVQASIGSMLQNASVTTGTQLKSRRSIYRPAPKGAIYEAANLAPRIAPKEEGEEEKYSLHTVPQAKISDWIESQKQRAREEAAEQGLTGPQYMGSSSGYGGGIFTEPPLRKFLTSVKEDPRKNANFKKWFGNSAAVNLDGSPRVLFHTTIAPEAFTTFKKRVRPMFWFSDNPDHSFEHYGATVNTDGARAIPAYISMQHPLDLSHYDIDGKTSKMDVNAIVKKIGDNDAAKIFRRFHGAEGDAYRLVISLQHDEFVDALKRAGYDGIIIRESGDLTFAAFNPNQIKSATGNTGEFSPKSEDIRYAVSIQQARKLKMKGQLERTPEVEKLVANTKGAKLTDEGIEIDLLRYQKPEQAGSESVRTGVFYLPAGSPKGRYFRTNLNTGAGGSYGGRDKITGRTLLRNPLIVKGAVGGKAPEQAFIKLRGKKAFDDLQSEINRAMRTTREIPADVVAKIRALEKEGRLSDADELSRQWLVDREYGRSLTRDEQAEQIARFLGGYGWDTYDGSALSMAYNILENSNVGNRLRYALQEHAVAQVVRDAGYDSVVGFSIGKGWEDQASRRRIDEIFDVRETEYPVPGMDEATAIHPDFQPESEDIRYSAPLEKFIKASGKTAIARTGGSAPARALAGSLKGKSVLDYGGGLGADVKAYKAAGVKAVGYDPNHGPKEKSPADVVTMTYVANTLPPKQRAAALRDAFKYAKDRLIVTVRADKIHGKPFEDGVITSKGTFQKSYNAGELVDELKKIFPSAQVDPWDGEEPSGAYMAVVSKAAPKYSVSKKQMGQYADQKEDSARDAARKAAPVTWELYEKMLDLNLKNDDYEMLLLNLGEAADRGRQLSENDEQFVRNYLAQHKKG